LCQYDDDTARARTVDPMVHDDITGVWSVAMPGDRSGTHYTYLVDVVVPGTGLVRNRVTDPYSLALGADSKRSVVVDLGAPALQPDGWTDDRAPALAAQTDLVVYELHVRDFSANDASVPAAHRGKYLAFADESNGTKHLRALAQAGVTDVHLLPVFDLATVPERDCVTPTVARPARGDSDAPQAAIAAVAATDCFNWGYDPLHYTVPEGSYATDAGDYAARIREFRAMVAALHRAGLRVGMDVVYNHTSAAGQDPKSVLDRIVPGYYHRLDANGGVEHSTCCANTATERTMMARLMLDSTEAWVRHYHVDSFRFDLMGHQPRAVMEALRDRVAVAAGKPVPLLGEGWNFGEVADGARFVQAAQLALNGSGIGTFSDRARDAVRGGGPADHGQALLQANGFVSETAATDPVTRVTNAEWLRAGLAGSVRDYALAGGRTLATIDYHGQPAGYVAEPAEVVNYVENHDNQTLFDLLALKLPADTPRAERARAQVLALATTAFSQGIAYFHAGVDVLRSKSLDRNSFDSGDWFNRLDWTYTDNGFGAGLPRAADNHDDWPLLAPRLADARIAPAPADIAFARDAFRDLLRIRASSTLFRLRTAADVRQRLAFPDAGADGLVIAGRLDGAGYPGANFAQVLYVLNADAKSREVRVADTAGQAWRLHPVQAGKNAADARVRDQARFDAARGAFVVPPRSAAVFVVTP
jgi:pullulanase-type alpha-1,6-glucosidase